MALVPVTAPEPLRSVEFNDLALNTTLYYTADLSFRALDIGLSGLLFGVLTFFVILSVVFLTRKGPGHSFVWVLLPSTLLLYGSAALYMAALVNHVISVNRLIAQAKSNLLSEAFTTAEVKAFERDVLKQSWMMTLALSTNVLIGDSIVWWRACAVWRNRIVYCIGPLLIALMLAFGVKALLGVDHCLGSCRQPQFLFSAGVFGVMCATLSLAVNLIATGLIGYKTWVHWRLLRDHFGSGRRKSRVVKALALLVESGAIYCILLTIILVDEASPALPAAPDVHQNIFLQTMAYYTHACFTYIIAIYPVLIIVIVALHWSPIEHDFADSIHLTGRQGRSITGTTPCLGGVDGATTTTTTATDLRVRHVRDVEDGVSEAEVGQMINFARAEGPTQGSLNLFVL